MSGVNGTRKVGSTNQQRRTPPPPPTRRSHKTSASGSIQQTGIHPSDLDDDEKRFVTAFEQEGAEGHKKRKLTQEPDTGSSSQEIQPERKKARQGSFADSTLGDSAPPSPIAPRSSVHFDDLPTNPQLDRRTSIDSAVDVKEQDKPIPLTEKEQKTLENLEDLTSRTKEALKGNGKPSPELMKEIKDNYKMVMGEQKLRKSATKFLKFASTVIDGKDGFSKSIEDEVKSAEKTGEISQEFKEKDIPQNLEFLVAVSSVMALLQKTVTPKKPSDTPPTPSPKSETTSPTDTKPSAEKKPTKRDTSKDGQMEKLLDKTLGMTDNLTGRLQDIQNDHPESVQLLKTLAPFAIALAPIAAKLAMPGAKRFMSHLSQNAPLSSAALKNPYQGISKQISDISSGMVDRNAEAEESRGVNFLELNRNGNDPFGMGMGGFNMGSMMGGCGSPNSFLPACIAQPSQLEQMLTNPQGIDQASSQIVRGFDIMGNGSSNNFLQQRREIF